MLLGGRQMIDNGRERAGELLEAAAADIEFSDGCYRITGTDRRVPLAAVAEDFEAEGESLAGEADFEVGAEVHANGCQISEVSIDPADGIAYSLHSFLDEYGYNAGWEVWQRSMPIHPPPPPPRAGVPIE